MTGKHSVARLDIGIGEHPCVDCGMETTPGKITLNGPPHGGFTKWMEGGLCEFYWVKNRVWKAAGMPKNGGGSLCVGCIEKRLGRELKPSDFDFSVDGYNVPEFSTERLLSRMARDSFQPDLSWVKGESDE